MQPGAARLQTNARFRASRRFFGLIGILGLLAACTGCPAVDLTQPASDGFLDSGDNSTFNSATALPLSDRNQIEFDGSISGRTDLDLYSLGELAPGDRLTIDVQHTSGSVDLVAGVFNGSEEVQAINDDRAADGSDTDPRLDFVIRGAAGEYFLGISPYVDSRSAAGDYQVSIQISRGEGLPAGTGQLVYLDWDGGDGINVPNVGTYDLAPFNSSDLGPYSGRSTEMKRRVEQVLAARYAGINLTIVSSDSGPEPEEPHSTVYFGGSDPQAFAISQQIDTLNADPSDKSIVFTRSFRGAFFRTPSFDEMCTALGNTVAHELGHLFGLVHTSDCSDLMDTSCSNERILTEQAFGTAPLDVTVFPVGVQNSADLLVQTLGEGN